MPNMLVGLVVGIICIALRAFCMRFADVLTSFTLSYMHVYGILMLFRARVHHPEGCAWARCGEPRVVFSVGG